MAEKPTVAYWGIRGRADGIRTLLRHLGVDFEDKMYTSPEEWGADKASLPMQFPNLPYYKDGDIFHSETIPIYRTICRKYKPELLGQTLAEQSRADALLTPLDAGFSKFISDFLFPQNYAEKAEEAKAYAVSQLEQFEKVLGDNNFIAGSNPTYADFMLLSGINLFRFFDESLVTGKVAEYRARVLALDNVQAAQDEYESRLQLPPFAGFMAAKMAAQ